MKLVEVSADDVRLGESQGRYFSEISERFGVRFDPHAGEKEGTDTAIQWHLLAVDGEAVIGCGSLRDLGKGLAEVKRVWVDADTRGRGVARAIMDELETIASDAGFSRIVLDTNKTLNEARAMYLQRGYREIERYNDNPYADHFFEKAL